MVSKVMGLLVYQRPKVAAAQSGWHGKIA